MPLPIAAAAQPWYVLSTSRAGPRSTERAAKYISFHTLVDAAPLWSLVFKPYHHRKRLLDGWPLLRGGDSAGLCSNRRPRPVLSIRAAFGPGHGDSVGPSAPPLPRELRTSERVNYPEVYSDSQDITGAPGTRQEQRSVSDSVFSTDQVCCCCHPNLPATQTSCCEHGYLK